MQMVIFCFLDDPLHILDEMVNPSPQILCRKNKIDICRPVPLKTARVTQGGVLERLEYVFGQNISRTIGEILHYKFEEISVASEGIFFLLNAFNGLQFVSSVKKRKKKGTITSATKKPLMLKVAIV